ncbi:MAG: hypothetical protein JJ957_00705 [Pseudomonadales bacterium]|nr:hypothetical protein [Pseudomonadales bacterium]MBO6594328.1 hypothetical protein [Pseudomonadales bacterium]MBO6822111.1 hypothetical protein [Pseudomonadales bacterium]
MSEERFLDLITPGASVYVSGSTSEPRGLLKIIAENARTTSGIRWMQFPIGAVNRSDLSALTADSTEEAFFMSPSLKDGFSEGRVQFLPLHMRTVFDYLRDQDLDVALLQAAPDRNGVLRFGPNIDFLDAVTQSAKHLVVEVNDAFVAPFSCPLVPDRAIKVPVKSDKPLFPTVTLDETSEKIGALIASVIKDGDCIQTGIGAVPAAILANLGDCSDLGFHGGLIDDGVMKLIRDGNLNGARKNIDRARHTTGMALGSEELLDWLAHDPLAESVLFRSADYTHEFRVISQIDNFVSINSAVEIDLMGQVNAEVAGGKQISGTGGSVDFMRSAKASKGGRSIIAMSATARGGSVSRIVPRVEVVTALRTDVDIVVTEFGIADIRYDSLGSRAEKLIAIAHPDFHDELRSAL